MEELKPKEQHELLLANADKEKIEAFLADGEEDEITKIAIGLARECNLFVHFQRLWQLRVADLDPYLSSDKYMRHTYVNKNDLYKKLIKAPRDLAKQEQEEKNAQEKSATSESD